MEANIRVDSLAAASAELVDTSERLKSGVWAACAGIASDLGTVVELQPAEISDSELQEICRQASAALEAQRLSEGDLSIHYQPADCSVDAELQSECEARCDIAGTCELGSIEERCDPADLSGVCEPESSCSAGAYCQGTRDFPANCQATCLGKCVGECEGECRFSIPDFSIPDGSCVGFCEGTCIGTCDGACDIGLDGGIDCGAQVPCKGGCPVESSVAPLCDGSLQPPACEIDVACQTGCQGQANFAASCAKAWLVVDATPDYSTLEETGIILDRNRFSTLEKTVEDHLPAILDAVDGKGRLAAAVADQVARRAGDMADELDGTSLCTVVTLGDRAVTLRSTSAATTMAELLRSASEASVSLRVTIEASAGVVSAAGLN